MFTLLTCYVGVGSYLFVEDVAEAFDILIDSPGCVLCCPHPSRLFVLHCQQLPTC
jgi:hypothetical protein